MKNVVISSHLLFLISNELVCYQMDGHKLKLFVNKLLRKIFVPKKDKLRSQFGIIVFIT
jgi:hypothetical protein